MLEFCKEVLTKVSFDSLLFSKELMKAINWVQGEELEQLRQWCLDNFQSYTDIIRNSFGRHL